MNKGLGIEDLFPSKKNRATITIVSEYLCLAGILILHKRADQNYTKFINTHKLKAKHVSTWDTKTKNKKTKSPKLRVYTKFINTHKLKAKHVSTWEKNRSSFFLTKQATSERIINYQSFGKPLL